MEVNKTDVLSDSAGDIRERVYGKDKVFVSGLGVMFFGTMVLMFFFVTDSGSYLSRLAFLSPIALALFGCWFLVYRNSKNTIEISRDFLRIDDCVFPEIPWSDIIGLRVTDTYSPQLGRMISLVIYLRSCEKYALKNKRWGISRRNSDGGVVATNLYSYAADHEEIVRDLNEAIERRRAAV
ncbi:hypothetical protein [Marinobacter zhejiangensis]|uniref:PH domain-containing protein n=1 Tax=Marinobacter zhejiangensis TaxID=488535 RepID=A0A1I4LAE5_9GAMM|nr:hypothetical protein [Marinobacter zhejiangensis]SFL87984.1 hypothetical protein SAMN04487963_0374 [Marinobacter zhejiangensis]